MPIESSSALEPAGESAERIATLFWWMTGGTVVIWGAVTALVVYAVWFNRTGFSPESVRRLILIGGVALPLLFLSVLLVFGLRQVPLELARAPEGSPVIDVAGEQWWWRVRYAGSDGGTAFELANELHLTVGEPVQLNLTSPDVIHSFWVPSLAGKVDMIPGRTTHLQLNPTRAGVFHGVCAEYCGASHALMAFRVVVEGRGETRAWREAEARDAATPEPGTPAARGADLFLSTGCGA
ncbi:MAG: cytochrome c oxidase subunit II, partial [Myxococcaceae bacterium]|nr:cytochrome c oxidase subunit II [Myxococcaceae bacterium]